MPKKIIDAIDERFATVPAPMERGLPKEKKTLGYTTLAHCCVCGKDHKGSAEGKFIRELHSKGWRYRESKSSQCDEAGWGERAGLVDIASVCPDCAKDGDW